MITSFKNLLEVFDRAHCTFCNEALSINMDSVTGYYKKENNLLLALDEQDGSLLFTVDVETNQTSFKNKDIQSRLAVFVIEFQCSKHQYRQTYTLHLSDYNYRHSSCTISKILLDEESVLLSGTDKSYWVRNLFDENSEPWSEISSWSHDEGPPPKSQFDLDVLDDLFATFKLETKWLKISPSMENFQERIENLITFG